MDIHSQFLRDSTTVELSLDAVEPGDHVCRPGEGSGIVAALISGEREDWASSAIEVVANIDSTVPETTN